MMRTEDWIGKVDTVDRPYFDSWRTHVLAVMYARVRVQVEMHRISAATCPPFNTRPKNTASVIAVRGSIRTDVPIRRTRSNRAARALFGQQSHWKLAVGAPPPDQVLSVPDLTTTRRSGLRASCGRDSCVAFVALRAARPSGQSRPYLGT